MKQYRDEYKREIVRKYSDGVTVQELSKETGASISTIYSWIKSSNGIIQSFSKPSTPYYNAVIESFFQNFKAECFNQYFNIKSKKELINIVDEYVNFYNIKNIKRLHSYLNYVYPTQFEEKYYKKNKQVKQLITPYNDKSVNIGCYYMVI